MLKGMGSVVVVKPSNIQFGTLCEGAWPLTKLMFPNSSKGLAVNGDMINSRCGDDQGYCFIGTDAMDQDGMDSDFFFKTKTKNKKHYTYGNIEVVRRHGC
jgi:hypothetical protein